jgi:hypothetical protein
MQQIIYWKQYRKYMNIADIYSTLYILNHLSFLFFSCCVGSCHLGMAHPWAADGGDGLKMWRVSAYVLNKKSCKVDKGWA